MPREASTPPRAVLLDALGTLVELEPPWPHLRAELQTRFGIDVTLDAARAAMRAEMAFYRAEHGAASDRAGLAELRRRCAEVLAGELPPLAAVPLDDVVEALLAAIRFRAYPDAAPALEAWRAAGAGTAVVSNWDVSLHDVLAATGLRPLVDVVVTSAELGVAKPDPRIFAAALETLGAAPGEALHAGDTPDEDVAGAQAAGIAAVLVARDGAPDELPAGVRVVASLAELAPLSS